jgi:hypothetical protein
MSRAGKQAHYLVYPNLREAILQRIGFAIFFRLNPGLVVFVLEIDEFECGVLVLITHVHILAQALYFVKHRAVHGVYHQVNITGKNM